MNVRSRLISRLLLLVMRDKSLVYLLGCGVQTQIGLMTLEPFGRGS